MYMSSININGSDEAIVHPTHVDLSMEKMCYVMKFIKNQTVEIVTEVFLMPEMFDLMLGRIFLCHEAVIL